MKEEGKTEAGTGAGEGDQAATSGRGTLEDRLNAGLKKVEGDDGHEEGEEEEPGEEEGAGEGADEGGGAVAGV